MLSLGYLAGIGTELGHDMRFLESMPDEDFDMIVVASSMAHYDHEIDFCRELKAKTPNCIVGLIGPFATEMPHLFEEYVDFIITGEPETVFKDILLGKRKPKGRLAGGQTQDLDGLPFPNWSIFPMKDFGYFPSLPRKPFATILGSRGCPFACEFCPYLVQQGVPLRRRSTKYHSGDELFSRRIWNKKSSFRDITWSMHKKQTKELCRLIAAENFDLDIGVETRADTLDRELIDLMSKAGVKVVNLGIESPSADIVSSSGRRPIKDEKLDDVLDSLDKAGINVQAFYILGLLDDDVQSMKRTVRYSFQLNCFAAQFCVLTPFPGTKTYHDLKSRLLTTDFRKFNEYDPVVKIDGATAAEIVGLEIGQFQRIIFALDGIVSTSSKSVSQ